MKRFDLARRLAEATDIVTHAVSAADADPSSRIVRLSADEDVSALSSFGDNIKTVILEFPTFRDGRAFTQARALREKLNFSGEICAIGSPLPDQSEFLRRCGFDAVLLEDAAHVALWTAHETHFPMSYQDAIFSLPN